MTTDQGQFYPDICRLPIDNFSFNKTVKQYRLRQSDIDRFDLTVQVEYGTSEYDDLVLWLNNVENIHDLVPGQVINFPDLSDLQSFLRLYRGGKNSP
jgi:hypothetical protein